MTRWNLAAVVAVAALVSAGCGPPEAKAPNFFELEPTKQCFEDADLRVSTDPKDLNVIIGTSPNGGLRVWFPDNSVLLGFAESDKGAADIVKAFNQVQRTRQERKRLRSLLEPRGNVLINWISEPNRREIDVVHNCLK